MEIAKNYQPKEIENKWNEAWNNKKLFKSTPDEREAYSIVLPPPNVTGVLHMGHMLNDTLQDVLIRKARLDGKNACWVPGTDHASIATEAKVVNRLREKGIKKSEIGREAFLEHAWEWKEEHGGIILEQMRKLGCSCDWDRTKFTMDLDLSDAVQEVFIQLYEKGYVFRGLRMINWDPEAQTALSNEEVIHQEVQSQLYYLKYKIEGSDEFLTVATTRPETIMGDTAVCLNPDDERYQHLKGAKVVVPLVNRVVPIIFDDYVDIEFGTGALKVTPAHDQNDYEIGKRHNLESIDVFNADGTLSEAAGLYVGEDRFVVRKKIAKQLEAEGLMEKVEQITNTVGLSERTNAVIEPRLSLQWFLNMNELVKPALENVANGNISFFPPKFINTYNHWLNNIHEWCLSRQLWWGHRIPVFYFGEGANDYVVAATSAEALPKAQTKSGNNALTETDLKQDEDVLDTWASSWLWPISVFDGFKNPDNVDFNYYYPTNVLVTAPEILFLWVARMVIAGYEFKNELPFKDVYLHGIVRDSKRRKMSKSLGNSPNPLDLFDKYSADGVRVGMLLCAPAGNDILFDEKLCEQGRNFTNKIWNALRLIKGWETVEGVNENNTEAINWMHNRIAKAQIEYQRSFDEYRISEALMIVYKLIWDDFCSWYLEMIKPNYGDPIDAATLSATIEIFEKLMQIAHPFIPFVTEEIWQNLAARKEDEFLTIKTLEVASTYNKAYDDVSSHVLNTISKIREIRAKDGLKNQAEVDVYYNIKDETIGNEINQFAQLIQKLTKSKTWTVATDEHKDLASFVTGPVQCFVHTGKVLDVSAELVKLEQEAKRIKGFITGVSKKLSNERFVQNAPAAVVALEKKKLSDNEQKLALIEQNIERLTTMNA